MSVGCRSFARFDIWHGGVVGGAGNIVYTGYLTRLSGPVAVLLFYLLDIYNSYACTYILWTRPYLLRFRLSNMFIIFCHFFLYFHSSVF